MVVRFMYSIKRGVVRAARGTVFLWTDGWHSAWDPLSLTEKCIWIFFVSNTIGLITMLEYLMMGHR